MLRDAIIWLAFADFSEPTVSLAPVLTAFSTFDSNLDEDQVARTLVLKGWGKLS